MARKTTVQKVNGFDFCISEDGELEYNNITNDVKAVSSEELKIQLAFTRIKSCINEWFYDEVGANLDELVGRNIKDGVIDVGEQRITEVLTFDGLWDIEDIHVQKTIKDKTHLEYRVYFRKYTDDEFGETSVALKLDLDLVKGVKVKYGWDNDNLYILDKR